MLEKLEFTITFYAPFRVATGVAARGIDAPVDSNHPLPASSLKGVMRAAARDVLELHEEVIEAVFGGSGLDSPWAWSDGVIEAPPPSAEHPHSARRHRVKIDPDSGTALRDHLQSGEVFTVPEAKFCIERIKFLAPENLALHQMVLTAAAHAVQGLGAQRRRGLGWVGVDGGSTLEVGDFDQLVTLRG